MSAAHFQLNVDQFFSEPWTDGERQQMVDWFASEGIDTRTNLIRAFILGEGYIDAEQYDLEAPRSFFDDIVTFRKVHPVRTLPPVWHGATAPSPRPNRRHVEFNAS